MKKLLNFILLFSFTATGFFSSLLAEEINDKTIQAVATLLSYVNKEIQDYDETNEGKIAPLILENKDIENLWTQAISLDEALIFAQEDYDLWRSQQDSNKQALQRCANYLRSAWLSASQPSEVSHEKFSETIALHDYKLNNQANNSLLNSRINKEIAPYLMDSNWPLAPTVDQIFSSSRPTFNFFTLTLAGFNILCQQPRSFITVASHPYVPGYLFKLYYDTELRLKNNVPGWKWFVRRCQGAELIRKTIIRKKIKHFEVPQKFIYVLPPATTPLKAIGIDPKLAVLIVQDMNLVNADLNYLAWKTIVTPQILDELYMIISYANGSSYRPDNIPFSYSGKFAFIDTEYPKHDPDFYSIRPYLSNDMCNYWDQLVQKGGPN